MIMQAAIAKTMAAKGGDVCMPKYGKKAQEEVEEAMHDFKNGELYTGSGKKVTKRKQAIAIGLSEAREKGGKVPRKDDEE